MNYDSEEHRNFQYRLIQKLFQHKREISKSELGIKKINKLLSRIKGFNNGHTKNNY